MLLSQFRAIGNALFSRGLVSSNSGNLSVRMGDRIIITRRGCSLGSLDEQDLIETGIDKNDRFTPLATIELPVHRAIYQQTQAQAIIHAHPPHAITLSLVETEIVPTCVEDFSEVGGVPVLGWNMEVKPGGLGDIIARGLRQHRVVVVRGHGSFAIGQLLEEAHNYTTELEEACQIICLSKSIKITPGIE